MIIPDITIQKIKEEADIVKVISDYIKLTKKSSNFVGLCPFHADQTPSLTVSPTKKIYKCFSCNASGNVFTFVQNYEKVSFPKAVQIVGEKCGITVDIGSDDESQSLSINYQILESSTNFYNFLLENTKEGIEAKKYLHKRNLTDEIINRFRIGLSIDDQDLLYQSLMKEKFQPLDMIESGVVRSINRYFDVFRNRIMFPLENINGQVVGFSGRAYLENDEPKYLNSSDNKVFKKGNILYNYYQAQNHIRISDSVFVFEGFMDVIAAYRANIHNAIATMGTAITYNQITAIKKATDNVIICFDGDSAGVEASKKAILLLLQNNLNVMAVMLEKDLDPDDYINKYGVEKFQNLLLKQQVSGYDYLYTSTKLSFNLDDLNHLEKFKNEIFSYLHYFKSNVLTERFLQRLSEDLNVSIDSLIQDFSNLPKQVTEIQPFPHTVRVNERPHTKERTIKDKYLKASSGLIYISLNSKEECDKVTRMLDNKFVDKLHNNLLELIRNHYNFKDVLDMDEFKSTLDYQSAELLSNILEENFMFKEIDDTTIISFVNDINSCYDEIYSERKKTEILENLATLDQNTLSKLTNEFIKGKSKTIKIKNKTKE